MTTGVFLTQQEASIDQRRYAVDEQTGEVYELSSETRADHVAAIISALYMLLIMAFFFWLLFDAWVGQFSWVSLLQYPDPKQLATPSFRLPFYAIIGGALGGIVNGIRSFLVWHAERFAFGQRFLWKYVTAPWLGATLALFSYTLIRSGVAIFDGEGPQNVATTSQVLATFSMGVLAGYGAHTVFVWLDAQVTRFFQVQPTTVVVPALAGRALAEAEDILRAARLKLGQVQEEDQDDVAWVGKVIRQTPPPGSAVATGVSVNLTVGHLQVAEPDNQAG
jgi:hypothetical protein